MLVNSNIMGVKVVCKYRFHFSLPMCGVLTASGWRSWLARHCRYHQPRRKVSGISLPY